MMYLATAICMILISLDSIQCTNDTTPDFTEDAHTIFIEIEKDRSWSEENIIKLLVSRSNDQRQEISKMYMKRYNMDLVRDLNRFCFFDTKRAILALMVPNHLFYAYQLHQAIDGFGTDEKAISQILGSMESAEILNVSTTYKNEYGVTLKEDLISDTSGPFMNLVVSLCNAERNESNEVDIIAAATDAQTLYKACRYTADKYHADEKTFTTILTTRSRHQLALVFSEYSKITNSSIKYAIRKEFKGETQYGFLTIVKFVTYSTAQFYAVQLEECMKGFGTDDRQLIRIIIGRSEIDLNEIKVEYKEMYGTELADRVAEETSGNYRKLLLGILNK